MNAVIEPLAVAEPILEVQVVRDFLQPPPHSRGLRFPPASAPLRQVGPRWCSTLGEQDLQCLLRIIEVDLIPQLLNSYSPALHAPVEQPDLSG